jgi:mannitol/fructose-specific phosphotransferase system IIA component (Ntr-type)
MIVAAATPQTRRTRVDELLEGLGFPVVTLPPAACVTREAAITLLAQQLVRAGHLSAASAGTVVARVAAREAEGASVLGRGLTLPHLVTDAVDNVTGVVGVAATGIPWPGGFEDAPVRHVVLLLTPAARPLEMLLAEERIVRHLFKSAFAREQAIRLRAYRYWDTAGRPAGRADQFWYEAERDLLADR